LIENARNRCEGVIGRVAQGFILHANRQPANFPTPVRRAIFVASE
jgi:hypothetical protein